MKFKKKQHLMSNSNNSVPVPNLNIEGEEFEFCHFFDGIF